MIPSLTPVAFENQWGWVDADWAGDTELCRSHRLHAHDERRTYLLEEPLSRHRFFVYFQTEFVAASLAGQKALCLCETLMDFGYQQNSATKIYKDNLACVAMHDNPGHRKF